ncbi:hypothetical protein HPB51_008700 [Rhipicephalus microplus]|uniref:Uncharacterized protein n=1 Tax=Rhipicephalus microplus TaxID=6941 RepID=A0A9J6F0L7_RHIMP|nr:hypothetical protein HPB51_008700 [Rhipicephalus microplus]
MGVTVLSCGDGEYFVGGVDGYIRAKLFSDLGERVGSAANSVSNSSYPVAQVVSSTDSPSVTTSKPVPAPQRTKTPRVRVPPPSKVSELHDKIPESAVEMPEDSAVSSLEVQFGGLEFGTDTFDFGANDGLAAVSTAQPTMPPGLVQTEQSSVAASVPSSTPYMDGHHSVSVTTRFSPMHSEAMVGRKRARHWLEAEVLPPGDGRFGALISLLCSAPSASIDIC